MSNLEITKLQVPSFLWPEVQTKIFLIWIAATSREEEDAKMFTLV